MVHVLPAVGESWQLCRGPLASALARPHSPVSHHFLPPLGAPESRP